MKTKKILSLALAGVMALALAVPAFATSGPAEGGSTTIPVTINATATTFDVTLPTAFPTTIDPDTGESVPTSIPIINNSSAPIKVSTIVVNNHIQSSGQDEAGSWKLAEYSADRRQDEVDAKKIGISLTPTGGTALTTVDGDEASQALQTLLDDNTATAGDWEIAAATGISVDDSGDKTVAHPARLDISYQTYASPLSATVTNEQVASIVITVAWNKG